MPKHGLKLNDKVIECLKKSPEKKFKECRKKQERSTAVVNPLDTDEALIRQLVAEIELVAEIGVRRKDIQKKEPNVKTVATSPRLYYYSTKTDEEELIEEEKGLIAGSKQESRLSEKDLYPKLHSYLYSEFKVCSKRIDEKRSSNTRGEGGNKWLFPDLVGMEDLSADWHKEIKECVEQYSHDRVKLWSFEVKLTINRSNVRESFFQTVSNSSWLTLAT